jgi:hypothetical protein
MFASCHDRSQVVLTYPKRKRYDTRPSRRVGAASPVEPPVCDETSRAKLVLERRARVQAEQRKQSILEQRMKREQTKAVADQRWNRAKS